MVQLRARDHGIFIGELPTGARNKITDVPGVTVGHVTIRDGAGVNTGVTAVLPHQGDLFRDKVLAASAVINGFGKTAGLIQVEELGTLEAGKKADIAVLSGDIFATPVERARELTVDLTLVDGTIVHSAL